MVGSKFQVFLVPCVPNYRDLCYILSSNQIIDKNRTLLFLRLAHPALLPPHFSEQLIMSSDSKQPAFTAPLERQTFAGVLLDLDGTIVDSKDAIIKHWHKSFNLASLQVHT